MRRLLVAVAGLTLLSGMALKAHHSYAEFDLQRTVSVEGTISQVLYANPHVILTIAAADQAPLTAEWAYVRSLEAGGVTERTLKAGDRVILTGNPSRSPDTRRLARLSEVHRPADGWRWVRGQGVVASPAK